MSTALKKREKHQFFFFSGYIVIQLEINNKCIMRKMPNSLKLKKKTLNNLWTKEVIKMDIKKYFI